MSDTTPANFYCTTPKSSRPEPVYGNSACRAYTGLILFIFVAMHLLNHSLGLVSVNAMEEARVYRIAITRSWPGTIILGSSLFIHMWLSLHKFAQRRTWRMNAWEAVQLGFGLIIPLLLFRHAAASRMLHEQFEN